MERAKSTKRDPDEELLKELQEGLQIDKNGLDEELRHQPELFHKVADRHAILVSLRDAAKQEIKVVEAEVDRKIRKDLESRDQKVTEKEIESLKVQHPQVLKANDEYLDLSQKVGRWQALKEAFIQRNYVLEPMVRLFLASYYGEVTVSRNGDKMKDKRADRAREEMSEGRRNYGKEERNET